jgi:peptidoglycan hydrolase-like protein with peptidoglycan-binding domain
LNNPGFPCGKADGIFSKQTEKSTKDFQEQWEFEADGVVGV